MEAVAITEVPYDPEVLKAARKKKGFTLRTAGEATGFHFLTIQRIESGTKTEEKTLERICTVYDIALSKVIKRK